MNANFATTPGSMVRVVPGVTKTVEVAGVLKKREQKLGGMLIEQGLITEDQLQEALDAQKLGNKRLGETLVDLDVLNANTLVNAIARQIGVRGCHLRHGLIDPKVVQLIDREEAKRLVVLPLFKVEDRLTVAMAEPQSLPKVDRLARLTGCKINPVMALQSNIEEYQDKYGGAQVNVQSFLTSLTETNVKVVEREPRFIRVSSFELLEFDSPKISFVIHSSKGTYVRTIAHDLGEKIGCGAHLFDLRRTAIENFKVENAVTLDAFSALSQAEIQQRLIPVYQAVPSNIL